MKQLVLLSLILLPACGSGEDDQASDSRICIVNDSFNDNSDNSMSLPPEEEIEEAELFKTTVPGGQVSICGTTVAIDAAIQNVNGDGEELSDFLSTGRRVQ